MDKIIVDGGRRLAGNVVISGAKNAALPILVSSLLTDGKNTYTNVPNLMDIQSTCVLLRNHGARVDTAENCVTIDAGNLNNTEAPYDLVRKMRASILVLGPLIARLKKARVSLPGGCAIGARPINLHLKALASLGAKIELKHGYVEAEADRLIGADIYFDIVTVTGTENIMMAAVLAEGVTILRNAAREPEVVALADVLNKMGADIRGAGTSVITITGVETLRPVSVSIIPDRIEAGTFMVAAALTRGDITLENCEPEHLDALIHKLRLAGAGILVSGKTIRVRRPGADIQRRCQNPSLSGIPHRYAGPVHGVDVRGIGSQHHFGNHFRKPVYPCRRTQANGRGHHHFRKCGGDPGNAVSFRGTGDGIGSSGQRLADSGRSGCPGPDGGQPGLSSGQGL